jgi:hypothetical protein
MTLLPHLSRKNCEALSCLVRVPSFSATCWASSTSSATSAGDVGKYRLDRPIERYGIDGELFDWSDEITAECPPKQANNLKRYLWRAVSGSAEGGIAPLGS